MILSARRCFVACFGLVACACSGGDGGDGEELQSIPAPAESARSGCTAPCPEPYQVVAGSFSKIYDPSIGETGPWYINDHTFVRAQDGTWHLFGITHAEPADPFDEKQFAHATAPSLDGTWQKHPPALVADPSRGETLLWAPHVIFHEGVYYMFYCGGGSDRTRFQIRLATSRDLFTWTREPAPLFYDGYDGRDPMVLRAGNQWVMYYTATSDAAGGSHVVAYRTSTDLRHWGERRIAFTDPSSGTYGGPTESPFVVASGGDYYLFIGPRTGYSATGVFHSKDPLHFEPSRQVGLITSHALEVVQDGASWYASHSGWGQGGVWLAPLRWEPTACAYVSRPGYNAIVQTAPVAAFRSLDTGTVSGPPRELLASHFRNTGPYLAVGEFGVTDRPGAPAEVEQSADGSRLTMRGIPMGDEPVTVDWSICFRDGSLDHRLTWHVNGSTTAPVWEAAFGLSTTLPRAGDPTSLTRDGDAAGFAPWSLSGDDAWSLVMAYRASSAFRENNRWFFPSKGTLSWQPIWSNGGTAWQPGTYAGGLFRMAISPRAGDRAFADRIAAELHAGSDPCSP